MLVLTRKHQEKIRIGDNITITVIRTKGKSVRIGIEAPPEVPVVRGELMFQDQSQKLDRPPSGLCEIDEATGSAVGTTDPHSRRTQPVWPAEALPATKTQHPGQPVSHVSLERIPRDQVVAAMPGLKAGGGPLREMLNRRALTA